MSKKDDFNVYRDVLGVKDRDYNGKIDWRDCEIERKELEDLMDNTPSSTYNYDDDDYDDDYDCDEDYDDDLDCDDNDDEYDESEEYDLENQTIQDDDIDSDYDYDVDTIDDEEDFFEEDETDYASSKYYATIPSDFIQRDFVEEKRMGIKDINLYCYWFPDCEGVLIITGEIIADSSLKKKFSLQCRQYDEDGDLIEVYDNFSYTGGNGFEESRVMPEIFFNRYPFSLELDCDDNIVPENIKLVPIVDEDDEDFDYGDNKSISTLNIDEMLSNIIDEDGLFIANMKKGDKIPKSMIQYVIENGIGVSEFKCVFRKKEVNDSADWANQLYYTRIISGKVNVRGLIYYLCYNDKNQLIRYWTEDLRHKKYSENCNEGFAIFPASEKLCKIIVYIGRHPSNYSSRPEMFSKLEEMF